MRYPLSKMKGAIKRSDYFKPLVKVYSSLFGKDDRPVESKKYWEKRYREGDNSGLGSYGALSEFKAEIINSFIREHDLQSVIEFGCGDGNQLRLSDYEQYIGFDVSESALQLCRDLFHNDSTKSFHLVNEYKDETADVTLSLDVIYHLVEDDVFANYMETLFSAADRYVIIYSSDKDHDHDKNVTYVRHRNFTQWIIDNMTGWELKQHVTNPYQDSNDYSSGSFANFYIYKKDFS